MVKLLRCSRDTSLFTWKCSADEADFNTGTRLPKHLLNSSDKSFLTFSFCSRLLGLSAKSPMFFVANLRDDLPKLLNKGRSPGSSTVPILTTLELSPSFDTAEDLSIMFTRLEQHVFARLSITGM